MINDLAVCEYLHSLLVHRVLSTQFVDKPRDQGGGQAGKVLQVEVFVQQQDVHRDHGRLDGS